MYRLWLNGLYGLYGPRCPLSSKRPINLISLSLSLSGITSLAIKPKCEHNVVTLVNLSTYIVIIIILFVGNNISSIVPWPLMILKYSFPIRHYSKSLARFSDVKVIYPVTLPVTISLPQITPASSAWWQYIFPSSDKISQSMRAFSSPWQSILYICMGPDPAPNSPYHTASPPTKPSWRHTTWTSIDIKVIKLT